MSSTLIYIEINILCDPDPTRLLLMSFTITLSAFYAIKLRILSVWKLYSWMSSSIWSFNSFLKRIHSFWWQQNKSLGEREKAIIFKINEHSRAREKIVLCSFLFFNFKIIQNRLLSDVTDIAWQNFVKHNLTYTATANKQTN